MNQFTATGDDAAYMTLISALFAAYERASLGKGKDRHANDDNFEDQPICTELERMGITPALYQIRKKALETLRMAPEAARNELLDIIVYAAAAYHVLSKPSRLQNVTG